MKLKYLLIISCSILAACNSAENNKEAKQSNPAKIVAWLSLTEQNNQSTRLLSGQISSAEHTRLSFESQGQIKTITIKVGEHFSAGQTLATLDKTNYLLQLQQAKAKLNTAIAERNQARIEVSRRENLVKSNAVSEGQLEAFKLKLNSARQNINAAAAQVKIAEKQLADTVLIAPFSGVITAQMADVAQLVTPNIPVFMVEAFQSPEVAFSIPENISNNINIGQSVQITLPALPKIELEGTITEISTQAQLGAFPARLILTNPPPAVKAGMTAEIYLQLNNAGSNVKKGFNIPPSALGADENNEHFVYRIAGKTNDLYLEKIPVTLTDLSDTEINIQGELQPKDKLVRSGIGFLLPEQKVTLMAQGARRVNP